MIRGAFAWLTRVILLLACVGFLYGGVVLGLQYTFIAGSLLVFSMLKRLRRGGFAWTHGTARFATAADAAAGGLLGEHGLILGRADFPGRPPLLAATLGLLRPKLPSDMACRMFLAACLGRGWIAGRMIRLSRYVHVATFAPTGAGKGVSVVVPNLLAYAGSMVVTDPKPELYRITAKHREHKFAQTIILFDPLNANRHGGEFSARTHCFNPLDGIGTEDVDFLDQCRDLASMLVTRSGDEKEPHWNDSAQLVICGFIAFVCACAISKEDRNLNSVRRLLASRETFAETLKRMQAVQGFGGVVSRLGHMLTCFVDRELGSVLTTIHRHMEFMDSPAISRHLAMTDFDTRLFRQGKATAYLTLPPERLVSLAGLQRLWIGSLLRLQTKGQVGEKNPVLWMLDEVAHLGRIQALEDAVTLLRGKGIRLFFFFQSIEQVTKCYGDGAKIVLDNIGTKQFFGTTSLDTADYISKCIGDATIAVSSRNVTRSKSRSYGGSSGESPVNYSSSTSVTDSDTGRRLVMASEVLTWPEDSQFLFTRNLPVVTARLLRYFEAPEFKKGGVGRRQGLSLAAVVMSLCLVVSGGVVAAYASQHIAGRSQPDGFTLPDWAAAKRSLRGWASWHLEGTGQAAPPLSEPEIETRLLRVTEDAYRREAIELKAFQQLRMSGAAVPRNMTPSAIASRRVATILAAQLEAEQQRQAFATRSRRRAQQVIPDVAGPTDR